MCCLYLTMSDTASHLCFFKAQWGHPSGNFCFSQSGGPHPNLFGTRDQFCEDNFSTDPDRVWFWDDSSTWRRQWHPTPVLLPGKSHGRRSLVGCSPWGRYKSDMTERLHFHFSLSHIGEGNGNPLQCSCLENPGTGEPGGLPSMGSHRVRHDWSDLAASTWHLLCTSFLSVLFLVGG